MKLLHAIHAFILAGHLQLQGTAGIERHQQCVWDMRATVTVNLP